MQLPASEPVIKLLKSAVESERYAIVSARLAAASLDASDHEGTQTSLLITLVQDLNALNARIGAITIGLFGLDKEPQGDVMPEPRASDIGFNIPVDDDESEKAGD
jgi:hypothetical protein